MSWLIDGNSDIDETINFLGTTTNQPLIVRTNHSANPAASERMRVSASGNVGIGTSDPRHGRLTLEDDDVPLVLKETNQAAKAGGLWRLALDGGLMRFDANSAAGGDFSSFASPLTMSPSGNVGIGTTSPPSSRFQLKSLTAIDEGAPPSDLWANFGQNAFYDGAWKRIDQTKAGVNFHI